MRIPPPPSVDEVPEEEREAYAVLARRVGGTITGPIVDGYFRGLLHAPALGSRLSSVGRFFRAAQERDSFPDRQREFVDMVLGVLLGCAPVFFEHLGPAVEAGVRPAAVRALLDGQLDALNDDERRERAFILAVLGGTLDDAQFEDMAGIIGVRGAVEYTAFVLFLHLTIRMFQALGVADPDAVVAAGLLHQHGVGGSWPPAAA